MSPSPGSKPAGILIAGLYRVLRKALPWLLSCSHALADNFTTGTEEAARFGTHEIVLRGDGSVRNPFETDLRVTFTPPSGEERAVTVQAFHDGGDTWRARLYVSEAGAWKWTSHSANDAALDGKSGTFTALGSKLRGMLRKHKTNPKAWMTDDGQWFGNVSDTAYRLFHSKDAPLWQEFVKDAAARGINCLRAASLGGWGGGEGSGDNNRWLWNDPWAGGQPLDPTRYDLAKFQSTDRRLTWVLNHYPDLCFQLILLSFRGYGSDETGRFWFSLPEAARTGTLRYMIARWSAFPNLFWLIVNDMHCNEKFPANQAFAREVGRFFAAHDPWKHLISSGPNRHAGFPFTGGEDRMWCSYIHLEDSDAVGGDAIHRFEDVPLHVWMAEDYYEQDYGHYADPAFFFRWLFWSSLLAGGSGNYGGRYGVIHPYSQTSRPDLRWTGSDRTDYTGRPLKGLDSTAFIARYFKERSIDLGSFRPNDARVSDLYGRTGKLRPKLAERGNQELLVYHPNASAAGKSARVDSSRTARMRLDLTAATGTFEIEWYRPLDGEARSGETIQGGAVGELEAPWPGQDVVLRLKLPDRKTGGDE
jgi:hypothetical protein